MSPETIETPSTGGDVEKNPVHRTDKDVAVLGSDEELLGTIRTSLVLGGRLLG